MRSDDGEKSQSKRNALIPHPSPPKRDPLIRLFNVQPNNVLVIMITTYVKSITDLLILKEGVRIDKVQHSFPLSPDEF